MATSSFKNLVIISEDNVEDFMTNMKSVRSFTQEPEVDTKQVSKNETESFVKSLKVKHNITS